MKFWGQDFSFFDHMGPVAESQLSGFRVLVFLKGPHRPYSPICQLPSSTCGRDKFITFLLKLFKIVPLLCLQNFGWKVKDHLSANALVTL